MADSNRYQPYGEYYWRGSSAMYWDYPPPVYTYGEHEARSRRPSTPVSASAVSKDVLVVDSQISGPGNGESDSENDVHPTLSTDHQNEVYVF